MSELTTYLQRVDRVGDPGFVFSETLDADRVTDEIASAFPGRPVFTLRANGLIPPTKDEVSATFKNSFEGKGVLTVLVDEKMPDPVKHAIEQICKDGFLPGDDKPLKPPDGWRMVVLARVKDPGTVPGKLSALFGALHALENPPTSAE
ncbi:MAG: hypothetical protein FJX76_02330 [Armatimonadetes bacterium]|nr:hypothetical protein [Armatimonadota bacterium]